jgi:hypothetical protein
MAHNRFVTTEAMDSYDELTMAWQTELGMA